MAQWPIPDISETFRDGAVGIRTMAFHIFCEVVSDIHRKFRLVYKYSLRIIDPKARLIQIGVDKYPMSWYMNRESYVIVTIEVERRIAGPILNQLIVRRFVFSAA